MAGRPKKVEEAQIQEPLVIEEIKETPEAVEVQVEDISDAVISVKESEVAPTITQTEAPTIEEVVYNPKDIVEFYNNKGELRYAPYAYITKRGYKALRKYTKKK